MARAVCGTLSVRLGLSPLGSTRSVLYSNAFVTIGGSYTVIPTWPMSQCSDTTD
jgi:hypothetical protein